MWWLLKNVMYPQNYIWVEVTFIRETRKAILIKFDNRTAWLPKAWILGYKRTRHCEPRRGEAIFIKIKVAEYHWAKKFG